MTDPESAKEDLHEERMTGPSAWVAVKALKLARIAGLREAAELCLCPGCAEDIDTRIVELEGEISGCPVK